jgi:hypothetical protein
MAVYANLTVDQGSDFSVEITVANAVGSIDITNYTYRGQIRKTYSSTTAVDFYASTADPANGKMDISLSAVQTSAMRAGRYVYDVEIVDSIGNVTRVVEGQLEVTPRVTRSS